MRTSGILLHISSLPSNYGIGSFGKEAYRFVDFLKDAGQYYWQILPLCPTGEGNSPYLSPSSFAGNPLFIDLDILAEEGLLRKTDISKINWGKDPEKVDFDKVIKHRFNLLRKAYSKYLPDDDFRKFLEENSYWLQDYALFMFFNFKFKKPWNEWDKDIKFRKKKTVDKYLKDEKKEILFWEFIQYMFFKQWDKLKSYAHSKNIRIIGDIPIYVAFDSADVWANRQEFLMDSEGCLTDVAGCPPDYFSEEGQLWGNPLYNWEYMKNDSYSWWKKRISHMGDMFDVIRIDHFRGLASYYCIPADSKSAKNGEWRMGPGIDFLHELEKESGKGSIIAEDLGVLTDDVRELLKESCYPGMKVLQFAFDHDGNNEYLPSNIGKNSVCYVGTHDNNTALGYIEEADIYTFHRARTILGLDIAEGYNWGMMKACWSSKADTAIVTMQDILGLDAKARMNTPSTPKGNWEWRMKKGAINKKITEKIYRYCLEYDRIPKKSGG